MHRTNLPQVKEYMEAAFGQEQFTAMQAALCTPPPATCLRVNTLRASLQVRAKHCVCCLVHHQQMWVYFGTRAGSAHCQN